MPSTYGAHNCCDEPRCRRATPILIRRGLSSDRWYAIVRYRESPDGMPQVIDRHDITDDLTAQLLAAGWTPPLEVG